MTKRKVWVGWTDKYPEDLIKKSEDGYFLHFNSALTCKKHNATPIKVKITIEVEE